SKKISGDPVIIPEELREKIGMVIRKEMTRLSHHILVISVAAMHCHFLVELPDDLKEIRRIVGERKRKASMALRTKLPGRVWAHDGKYKGVDSVEHQRNTYGYILKQNDGWLWSHKKDDEEVE